MAAIVVEREFDARGKDRVAQRADADAAQDLEGVGGGGGRAHERVGGAHAPATRDLPVEQQLHALHRAEVAVAKNRRIGVEAQRHGGHQPVEPLDVEVDSHRGDRRRPHAQAELVLHRRLEAQVGVAAAEASGAQRVVERRVHQILKVRRLAEVADAGHERRVLQHRRHRDTRVDAALHARFLRARAGRWARVELVVAQAEGECDVLDAHLGLRVHGTAVRAEVRRRGRRDAVLAGEADGKESLDPLERLDVLGGELAAQVEVRVAAAAQRDVELGAQLPEPVPGDLAA